MVAHACFFAVHYIWRINGAPQETLGRHREMTFRAWTKDAGCQESWSANHDSALYDSFPGRGDVMMLSVLCVLCYGDLVLLILWVRLGWSEFFQTTWEARHFYADHCVRKKAGSCRPSLRVTRDWKRDLDPIALHHYFNVFNVDSIRFSTVLCSLTRDRDNLSRPFWSRKLPTQKLQGEAGVGPLALRHRVTHDRHVALLATLRCGSLRLESANLRECGLVHGEFTVLRRASLTRHSRKCGSLGVVGSPLAWLLTLRLACPSVCVLEAALPLLSLLELLMKPMDQCGDGLAMTAIRAQSIKVLDLDQGPWSGSLREA